MKKPFLPGYILIAIVILLSNACKKDNKIPGPVTVALIDSGFQEQFIRYSQDTTTYNVRVSMTGEAWDVPNRKVSLAVDPSVLLAYNSASGTHFELLPDSTYSLAKSESMVLTGLGRLPIPVDFFTARINPYIKYVLPLKLLADSLDINPAANTMLLRVLLSNNFTGVYADTISSAATYPVPFPYNPGWNFTDSVVYKTLTAASDSAVVMDVALPSIEASRVFTMRIDQNNDVRLEISNVTPAELTDFTTANASLQPYFLPAKNSFYIPYNYFNTEFRISERLKRL